MAKHSELTSVHLFAHVAASDPGAVGAGHGWVDTTGGANTLKIRDAANTGWEAVGTAAASPPGAGDVAFTPAAGIAATDVQAAIVEDAGDLAAHRVATTAAHPASAIAFTPVGSIAATDVQAALAEVASEAGGAPAASGVAFTPAAGIAATDVQAAIVEDAGDLAAHLADATAAHPASAVAFTPTGTIAATDVQAALAEVASEAGALGAQYAALTFVIDGGGSAITTGIKGDLEVPANYTILRATALADQAGSIVVDVWRDTYSNFPPVDAGSITASAPVTIGAASKSQDTALTGWSTSLAAGDILRFHVDSCATITRASIILRVRRV